MDKYVCNVCGYIYDPEDGAEDCGVDRGTDFGDIDAEAFLCPMCGGIHADFSKTDW